MHGFSLHGKQGAGKREAAVCLGCFLIRVLRNFQSLGNCEYFEERFRRS